MARSGGSHDYEYSTYPRGSPSLLRGYIDMPRND